MRGGAKTGRWRTRVTIWVEANGGTGPGSSVAGGEKHAFAVIFGRSFCPTAEFTYRITLAKTNGTLSMVIPEHTITCIPTLALQTTSDRNSFKVRIQSCHKEVPSSSFGDIRRLLSTTQQLISIATKSMQKPAASLESHNLPRAASSRRQGRAL